MQAAPVASTARGVSGPASATLPNWSCSCIWTATSSPAVQRPSAAAPRRQACARAPAPECWGRASRWVRSLFSSFSCRGPHRLPEFRSGTVSAEEAGGHYQRPGWLRWRLTRQRFTATGAGSTVTASMAPPTRVSSPAHRSATEYSPATLQSCPNSVLTPAQRAGLDRSMWRARVCACTRQHWTGKRRGRAWRALGVVVHGGRAVRIVNHLRGGPDQHRLHQAQHFMR